jgi:hypothetical protein
VFVQLRLWSMGSRGMKWVVHLFLRASRQCSHVLLGGSPILSVSPRTLLVSIKTMATHLRVVRVDTVGSEEGAHPFWRAEIARHRAGGVHPVAAVHRYGAVHTEQPAILLLLQLLALASLAATLPLLCRLSPHLQAHPMHARETRFNSVWAPPARHVLYTDPVRSHAGGAPAPTAPTGDWRQHSRLCCEGSLTHLYVAVAAEAARGARRVYAEVRVEHLHADALQPPSAAAREDPTRSRHTASAHGSSAELHRNTASHGRIGRLHCTRDHRPSPPQVADGRWSRNAAYPSQ